MSKIFLILGAGIIFALTAYAFYLFWQLHLQKKAFQTARLKRQGRLVESCLIIAKAMQEGQCNFSEGVIRLKMLLEPMGDTLQSYPAMKKLYETVMDMPTHDKRRLLKKAERQHLDDIREKTESDTHQQILDELPRLIQFLKNKERL